MKGQAATDNEAGEQKVAVKKKIPYEEPNCVP